MQEYGLCFRWDGNHSAAKSTRRWEENQGENLRVINKSLITQDIWHLMWINMFQSIDNTRLINVEGKWTVKKKDSSAFVFNEYARINIEVRYLFSEKLLLYNGVNRGKDSYRIWVVFFFFKFHILSEHEYMLWLFNVPAFVSSYICSRLMNHVEN